MKFITIAAIFFAAFHSSDISAQLKENFGIVTTEEAALKECAFEPGAAAVVLVDEGLSDHDGDLQGLLTFQHTKIKILKEECIRDMDFSISFRSQDDLEKVDEIQAIVINFDKDGRKIVTEVDKKLMYRRKVNATTSEITFAYPDLHVGSIIEYWYRFTAKHYWRLRDWSFQSVFPVYRSSYELKMVPDMEISYAVQKKPEYNITIVPSKRTNSIFFEMKNIPGLHMEPFMASRRDNLQMVFFEVSKFQGTFGTEHWMSTWDEVTKHLYARDDFGSQIKMKVSECDNYVASAISGKADIEKMNMIYDFVRKNISWNNEYGLISTAGVRDAWSKKSGSSASMNLLLINMLKTAGLEVHPILVSERGHGKINTTKPLINQFNNVYAVVTIDRKNYYLDATEKFNSSYLVPQKILNTVGFVANIKNGVLLHIDAPEERAKDIITIQADLSSDNILKGAVNIKSMDYSKINKLKKYSDEKSNYAEVTYKKPYNLDVENFAVTLPQADNEAFTESFNFSIPLQKTNDYWFLPVNMLTGIGTNPFLDENRFSDIDFGYKKTVILNYVINLPAGKSVSELAKNIQLVNADKSLVLSRAVSYIGDGNKVVVRIKFEQNKGLYPADEYADIKEFFKKMSNILEEQCVIKDK